MGKSAKGTQKYAAVVDLSRYGVILNELNQQLGAGAVAELNRRIQELISDALGRARTTGYGAPSRL